MSNLWGQNRALAAPEFMNVSCGMRMSMREGALGFHRQNVDGFGQGLTSTTGDRDENCLWVFDGL